MLDLPLARCYSKAGFGLGGVLLKQSLYPGRHLLNLLQGAGLVLDFGCGEGLLTNLLARALPGTRFVGVDLDAKKIVAASQCRTKPETEFHAGDFFAYQAHNADAVIFNDVLHHLPVDRQLLALQHAASCLREDGVIILKEVNPADRWDVKHTTHVFASGRMDLTPGSDRFPLVGIDGSPTPLGGIEDTVVVHAPTKTHGVCARAASAITLATNYRARHGCNRLHGRMGRSGTRRQRNE
jgi:SAM-dependent methyltransferase